MALAALQRFDVTFVLAAAGRQLVADQVLPSEERNRNAVEVASLFGSPSFVKRHAAYSREDVDAVRGAAELNGLIIFKEIPLLQAERTKPELVESLDELVGVLWRNTNEQIDVAGATEVAVERQRMRADNEEFNAQRV